MRPVAEPGLPSAFPRRAFMAGAGGLALSAALVALPEALARRGWLDAARAAETDLTVDTINGLVAFVMPGGDAYSVAQGESVDGPGGIAAGATAGIIVTLDRAAPAPLVGAPTGASLPASGGVALLLNTYAVQVDPGASAGGFVSPFARLSFASKAEVLRRFEGDPAWAGTPLRTLGAILPTLPALLGFSEVGVFERGGLTGTPVGWRITGYDGLSDGWDELKGYYGGRRAAGPIPRAVRGCRRNRRRRVVPRQRRCVIRRGKGRRRA